MSRGLTLEVYREGAYASTLRFEDRDVLKIGRLRTCDVRLEDSGIGRIHALIESTLDGAGFTITRMSLLGSMFLNGGPVTKSALKLGDEIMIGEHTIRVVRRRPPKRRRTRPTPPTRESSTARINVPEMLMLPWADEDDFVLLNP